jgi:hypothetical protein
VLKSRGNKRSSVQPPLLTDRSTFY